MINNFILIGEMGSGKDTLACLLPNVTPIAFGDKLRVVAKMLREEGVEPTYLYLINLFGYQPLGLWAKLSELHAIPKTDAKDRFLLQEIGTWCRNQRDDIWVNALKNDLDYTKNYVITDCRRPSEFEAFRDFLSIYIDAPLDIRKKRILERDNNWNDEWPNHPAEREIRDLKWRCDFMILNDSTVVNLNKKVKELLDFIKRNEVRNDRK